MKTLFFGTILILIASSPIFSQDLGEIREVELILVDIPFSGDAKQTNFLTLDSTEIISFNDITWLDKHFQLYDFFHKYRDACFNTKFHFVVTMIYIPIEDYEYKRYEGYLPTGKKVNTWVLTSIIELDTKQYKKP